MKAETYKKYSEIKTIGDIPAHWKIEPLKYNIGVNRISLPDSTLKDTKILYVDIESVLNDGTLKEPEALNFGDAPSRARRVINPDDTIISTVRTYLGSIAYFPNPPDNLICSTGFAVLTPYSKLVPKFLYYWIRSSFFVQEVVSRSVGVSYPALNSSEIGRLPCLLPSIEEQNSIVQLLDIKTKQITEHIFKRRKLIDLLKENRQSLISRLVTTGIDSNVDLKNSGIEWIEGIPEHWNIAKIKHSSYVRGRVGWQGLRSDEFIDNGPYLITGTDFEDGGINWEKCYHVSKWRYDQDPYIQVKSGDLLITKDGTIGKLAYVDFVPGPATLNSHLLVLRPLEGRYITRFLYWVLSGEYFNRYVKLTQTGTTFFGITQEKIEDFVFALPVPEEQEQISRFLDKKINKFDLMVKMVEKQIEMLQEYHQTLISSAVTGKIDIN